MIFPSKGYQDTEEMSHMLLTNLKIQHISIFGVSNSISKWSVSVPSLFPNEMCTAKVAFHFKQYKALNKGVKHYRMG